MIDRVGNGNAYIPPYDRGGKKAARVEGDAPAFLLPGEENGGVIWERNPKEDIPKFAAGKEKKEKKEEYIPPKEEEMAAAGPAEEEYKQSGFGKLLGRIGEAIKNFFLSLWYGGEKEDTDKAASQETADNAFKAADGDETAAAAEMSAGSDDADSVTAETGTDNADDRTERIRSAIAANDPDALMEELTEGGKKHPAKNTSLLTHYDKKGRIVKQDDSEVGRILSAESSKRGKSGRNVERRPQGNYRRYI